MAAGPSFAGETWEVCVSSSTDTTVRSDTVHSTPGGPQPGEPRPAEPPPVEYVVDGAVAGRDAADLAVTGRNVEVPEHFRAYVAEKLLRLERYDPSLHLFDVELTHERNRRQAKNCQRVEITGKGKGPVVRAEACADSFYAALEAAVAKLESRLRRAGDRRKVHHGRHTPVSVAAATAALEVAVAPESAAVEAEEPGQDLEGPGRIVRTKEHPAVPMSIDDALYEMELVGHDFFLFQDAETDRPSVVYRRHAFDYGVIRLA